MRRSLSVFKSELETQAKKQFSDLKIDFNNASLVLKYRKAVKKVEDEIKEKNQQAVRQQNKIYYELKAKELLENRDQDFTSTSLAKMLVKN